MDLKLFVAGLAMGLAIAAPLGPVNLIVIREAVARGWLAGLIVGLGAVLADCAFAAIAAFGLSAITNFYDSHATAFNLSGGTLLVAIGIGAARSHVAIGELQAPRGTGSSLARAISAFATTITNPGALIGVLAVFSAMANVLKLQDSPARPYEVITAFAAGGLLWWFGLSFAISLVRKRLSEAMLNHINRWTGVVIAAFGFVLLMNVWG